MAGDPARPAASPVLLACLTGKVYVAGSAGLVSFLLLRRLGRPLLHLRDDLLAGLLEFLAKLGDLARLDPPRLALDHAHEGIDLFGFGGIAVVLVLAFQQVGGGQFVALGIEHGEPGDSARLLGAILFHHVLARGHPVHVHFQDDEITGEDRADFRTRQEVFQLMAPAAPGRAEGQEDLFVLGRSRLSAAWSTTWASFGSTTQRARNSFTFLGS